MNKEMTQGHQDPRTPRPQDTKTPGRNMKRTSIFILIILITSASFSGTYAQDANTAAVKMTLAVAAVQMRSTDNLNDNITKMSSLIRESAERGARVAVFPECALSGYSDKVKDLTADEIMKAEQEIALTCRESDIYAVVGLPWREKGKLYNSASIISPEGRILERYHKIQLAEAWPDPGDHLSVFHIDGLPCSVIICHDERYPELVRLPVLAGARLVFYISHESGIKEESKIEPYRAQVQARAVENNIFIVQSNAPANTDATGSNGHSRIIGPDGNIIREASVFREDIIIDTLDLSKAGRGNALNSMKRGILQEWWKEGIEKVRIIN